MLSQVRRAQIYLSSRSYTELVKIIFPFVSRSWMTANILYFYESERKSRNDWNLKYKNIFSVKFFRLLSKYVIFKRSTNLTLIKWSLLILLLKICRNVCIFSDAHITTFDTCTFLWSMSVSVWHRYWVF